MADFNPSSINEIQGPIPWLSGPRDRNGYIYRKGLPGFHEEINNLVSILMPTQKEIEKRTGVFNRIHEVILQLWPTANVETFGSFRFGLFLPSSDIDIRVLIGDVDFDPSVQRQVLIAIKDALSAQKMIVESKTKLLDGKLCGVAVLKVTDKISTVNVDIVAKKVKGPDAAALIQWWCDQWPMAPKLFLVLKQFIVFHNLDGVYRGGLNSYSLIIMIVCFLRMMGKELHWHMDTFPIVPKVNLGILLYEFLRFYGETFDYRSFGLRARDGGSYFRKQQHERANELTIEDPLEQNQNISGGTFGIENVKRAFSLAAAKLKHPMKLYHRFFPEEGFLGRIIRISPSTIEYRQRILQDFTYSEIEALLNSEEDSDWRSSPVPSPSPSVTVSICQFQSHSRQHGQVLQPIHHRHQSNNNNNNNNSSNINFSTPRNSCYCPPKNYKTDRDRNRDFDWHPYTRRGYY